MILYCVLFCIVFCIIHYIQLVKSKIPKENHLVQKRNPFDLLSSLISRKTFKVVVVEEECEALNCFLFRSILLCLVTIIYFFPLSFLPQLLGRGEYREGTNFENKENFYIPLSLYSFIYCVVQFSPRFELNSTHFFNLLSWTWFYFLVFCFLAP